jgi:hypothetical protein
MNRWNLAVLCFAASAGFGDAVQDAPAAKPADTIVMEGIELQFHKEGPTFGESRPPTFRVNAARGAWAGSSRQWNLEDASAVIHREGEDDLLLSAARGFCDLDAQVAELSEGVRLTAGAVAVDIANLRYDNESGIAESGAQAQLTDGENRMSGSAFLMDTRKDFVELTDGAGSIRMAAAQDPVKAPAPETESDNRFESLDLDFEGVMRFNLNGQLGEVTENVVLILNGIDPADNLKVMAQKVTFDYLAETDKQPSVIHLTGDVRLEQAAGTGRADTVTINFDTGDVEFRGNAELSGESFEGARADVITFNLRTKNATLGPGGGRIQRVKLNTEAAKPAEAPAPPRS